MSIFIDFHVLQTVPPSCVNRDDTGSPKTAVYGGTVRARVSSQAWKRAIRKEFVENLFPREDLAVRTLDVVELIQRHMLEIDGTLDPADCRKKAEKALEGAGLTLKTEKKKKTEKDETTAKALFFMSYKQARALAECALNMDLDAKKTKEILKDAVMQKTNPSVDIALFGRMVADDKALNCDAAAQVAHAISTHAVQNEFDYFTAVDDLKKDESTGAGHLGTVEFNSATLYRYATVNASELVNTIGKESVAETVRKFGQAFICSMPTGKQNTFANRTLPDFVYVTIRKDQPINLSGAFEAPVKKSDAGYAEASRQRLEDYAEKVYSRFAAPPDKAFYTGESFGEHAVCLSREALMEQLEQAVNAALDEV